MTRIDRILFGDNQFFGIDHLSEEKSTEKAIRFKDPQAIIDVLNEVYDMGIRTFMCTTHEKMNPICNYYRDNQDLYEDFCFYPCMPYAHKYANSMTDHGIVGTLRYFAKGKLLSTATSGVVAAVNRDLEGMMKILVDMEMKPFTGLKTPVIFLQNVVTDLLLGMGAHDFFIYFSKHIKEKYNAEAGFITMNMPRLLDVLKNKGIENPIICTSFNKMGFRMSVGREEYERTLDQEFRCIAMQVLAAGALKPEEAIDYICQQDGIVSILFGASSLDHIRRTKELIENYS